LRIWPSTGKSAISFIKTKNPRLNNGDFSHPQLSSPLLQRDYNKDIQPIT
jgi:uncharacterized membrane protein YeaQ/YmgE (transglycosylase-associated protein family)